jgi:hypothetical protein
MRLEGLLGSRKRVFQTLAFLLILIPPVGLYFTVAAGMTWATVSLLLLITAGMILALLLA